MISQVIAGLLALALHQEAPLFSGPLSWSLKLQAPPSLDAPSYSFDSEVDLSSLVTVSDSNYVAIFGHRTRAAGLADDMDYRCALIVSRDKKNGWLIDRKKNTAVRVKTHALPEWCSE